MSATVPEARWGVAGAFVLQSTIQRSLEAPGLDPTIPGGPGARGMMLYRDPPGDYSALPSSTCVTVFRVIFSIHFETPFFPNLAPQGSPKRPQKLPKWSPKWCLEAIQKALSFFYIVLLDVRIFLEMAMCLKHSK